MGKSWHTEAQIIAALKQKGADRTAADIAREYRRFHSCVSKDDRFNTAGLSGPKLALSTAVQLEVCRMAFWRDTTYQK